MDIHYEKYCDHYNVITDFNNGAEVCTDCGLVIENQIFSCYNKKIPAFKQFSNEIEDEYWAGISNPLFIQATELINEQCHKYMISEGVCSYACKLLSKEHQLLKASNMKKMCATYFYESAQYYSLNRSFTDICRMFGVNAKTFMSDIGKRLTRNKCQIDETIPSHILPRVQLCQSITFKQKMEIGSIADKHFEMVNASANSVLAFTIYKYLQNNPNFKKMSMNKVAQLCSVSPTSIKRLLSRDRENKS